MRKFIIAILLFLVLISNAEAANLRYVSMNNSGFTVVNETNSSTSLNLTLTGKNVSNITFYTNNVSGQTNITGGYHATNATSIKAVINTSNNPLNTTLYIITDGTITNPIIRITQPAELQSSNLPAALIAGGAITTIIIIYRKLKKRN